MPSRFRQVKEASESQAQGENTYRGKCYIWKNILELK